MINILVRETVATFRVINYISVIFIGLLQSIKIGSNKMMKGEEASNFFGSSVQYSYTDFSSIDHRIKLHIILNVFEHENEELVLLLRVRNQCQSYRMELELHVLCLKLV